MNTTPNPRATKKSSGELVGPPGLLLLLDWVDVALGAADEVEVGDDMFVMFRPVLQENDTLRSSNGSGRSIKSSATRESSGDLMNEWCRKSVGPAGRLTLAY